MRTRSIDYWINKSQSNGKAKVEPKDDSEFSYKQIAEYYISRENKKTAA